MDISLVVAGSGVDVENNVIKAGDLVWGNVEFFVPCLF